MNKHIFLKLFAVLTLLTAVSSCVTVNKNGSDDDASSVTEITTNPPKVVIKTQTRLVGCPPMKMPKLQVIPPLPRAALNSADPNDPRAIDKIMVNYIAQLRKVNENNMAIMRRAVSSNNSKCKK